MRLKKGPEVAKRVSFRRLEDVEREWDANPELREAYRREVPFAEVAEAIVGLRARHGLSQSEFALKVGRPQSYIARLESGKSNVQVATLLSFAQALGEDLNINFDTQAATRAARPRGKRGPGQRPNRSTAIA